MRQFFYSQVTSAFMSASKKAHLVHFMCIDNSVITSWKKFQFTQMWLEKLKKIKI